MSMGFPLYLAMTAAEAAACGKFPQKAAWMACHFSAYGSGLCNFPEDIPAGSMLILNDRMPVQGHDPEAVARQLWEAAEHIQAERVLLDFQRPGCPDAILQAILKSAVCPVAVTEDYGKDLDCPLFLPPPKPHIPLKTYLKDYEGREIWLEVSCGQETVTVTADGSKLTLGTEVPEAFSDNMLHCHYDIAVSKDQAVFRLGRTREDVTALLKEAETLGVTCAVGLYQELRLSREPQSKLREAEP